MPLFHSVGASDPLEAADVRVRDRRRPAEHARRVDPRDGLDPLQDQAERRRSRGDFERVVRVDRVVNGRRRRAASTDWKYSLDFNEGCPNVEYLLEFLRRVREATPGGFERIQYIEQPTARDLQKDRGNVMHEAAKLSPVVIDESLTGSGSLLLAREMGYTGVALKACKGQSQALLMAAAAQKYGMFLCVQDLTCPGASLIHSAGLAAHVPGSAGIEANARQYVPRRERGRGKRVPRPLHDPRRHDEHRAAHRAGTWRGAGQEICVNLAGELS